jgi:gamma-glutamylputrescine oxidase
MAARSLWLDGHRWTGFPPVGGEERTEVAVVGAGITGAACALALRERGVAVTVVEAARAAAGASGRNGGFAVTGTALGFAGAADLLGQDAALLLQRRTERALDAMERRAAELGVAGAVRRTGSLWAAREDEAAAVDRALVRLRAAGVACEPAPELVPPRLRRTHPLAVLFPRHAALDPVAFVRALVRAAAAAGAGVRERSRVTALRRDGAGWQIAAGDGALRADAVVVACDGLTAALLPELAPLVHPVRNQMLATAPLAANPLRVPTSSSGGDVYCRATADGRVALGGLRRVDEAVEYTAAEGANPRIQAALERFLRDSLGVAAPITHRWSGVMGFSPDLLPVVGAVPGRPGLFVAAGYSGVGNVQGYACGELVAGVVATGGHPDAALYAPDRFAATAGRPPDAASHAVPATSPSSAP